jgi:hypothetical protein
MACGFAKGEAEQYLPSHEFMCQEEFNYYFDHPNWHTEREHGPRLTLGDLEMRQLDERDPDKFVSHFLSEEAMQNCRIAFLETFEQQMALGLARGYENFRGTFIADVPIGEGLPGQFDAVHNIYICTFECVWTGEHWSEITAYPDLGRQFGRSPMELESFTPQWRAY